jgi:hypothetical protein
MPTANAFSGGAIQYDDADRNRAQQIAQMQDYAMRMALQSQVGQQSRLQNQDTIQAQLAQNGTFGQKTSAEQQLLAQQQGGQYGLAQLANQGNMDVAKINMAPNQTYADLAKQEYSDKQPMIQSQNQLGTAKNNFMLQALQGASGSPTAMQPGGAGGNTSALDPYTRQQILGGMFGYTPYNPQQAYNQALQQGLGQAAAQRFSGGDISGGVGILKAGQTGDFSAIPQQQGLNQMQQGALANTTQSMEPTIAAMERSIAGTTFDVTGGMQTVLHQQAATLRQQMDNMQNLPPQAKEQLIQQVAARLQAAVQHSGGPLWTAKNAQAAMDDVIATLRGAGTGGNGASPMSAATPGGAAATGATPIGSIPADGNSAMATPF